MKVNNILIVIHYPTNIGYAIETLEAVFFDMARACAAKEENIHFAYKSLEPGHPRPLPLHFKNIIEFDPWNKDPENKRFITDYIARHNINLVFGFDFPVYCPTYAAIRKGGAAKIVSYFGASVSSLNHGLKLLAKRIQVLLTPHKPDLFIFESKAMRKTAVQGRGISKNHTTIVKLGVDIEKFKPDITSHYAYKKFNIPRTRKIVFYSGHMQERKGVDVIINAASEIVNVRERKDVHFLILGNKDGEENRFDPLYKDTIAEQFITFGGYRDDIDLILPSCYIGTIASTGWDSFTMSSIEMASSGLPLIVSNLQGLVETIHEGNTGLLIEPGDYQSLSDNIEYFVDHPDIRDQYSRNARRRAIELFSTQIQHDSFLSVINSL